MLLKDSNEIIGIFSNFITAIRGQLCILSPIVQFHIFSPLANKFLGFFCCGFDYLDSAYWTILIITGSRSLRVVIAFRDLTGLKIFQIAFYAFENSVSLAILSL